MADTFIKRPVLYKGTKAQIESATMGENDFGIATDVEFYTKEEINSLIGEGTTFEVQVVNSLPATGAKGVIYLVPKDGAAPDVHDEYVWIESTSKFELIGTTQIDLTNYATKTELNAKQDKLTATGTLSLPVYYDGTRLKEVTRLRAEMVSGGFDGEIYYAHHPEMSNAHILPFIYNDFAFIDKKGGSYTVTRNDGGEITNPHNIFDAAPSFMLSRGFTADTVWTAEISTPTNFTYSTLLYVDFGAAGFFCSYIKVEAQHSGTGEWKTVLEKTDNALSYLYCRCSSDDVGVNKFRFTFKNPIGSQFRISSIGAIAYKSAGIEETVLTLKGGTVFGDVIAPNITKIQNETTSIKGTLDGKVNIAQGAENAGKILKVDDNGNATASFANQLKVSYSTYGWEETTTGYSTSTRSETPKVGDLTIYNEKITEVGNDYIVIYGSSKRYQRTPSLDTQVSEMLDIVEILANKADIDLSNITSVAKTKIVNAGQPDYSAGVSVSAATILAGYTAPSAGFLATSTGWLNLTVNGNNLPTGKYIFANNTVSLQQIFIPLNAGDVLVGTGGYQIDSNIFFPLKEI